MSYLEFSPEKIRQLRQQRGWSIRELSIQTGIDSANLTKMETGKRKITIQSAMKISTAFGCWLDELLL